MKLFQSIQIKAALLLAVFSLNTVMTFACSMGLNMGYNEKHHGDGIIVADAHSHSSSLEKKYNHSNSTSDQNHGGAHKHSHAIKPTHSHDDATSDHHQSDKTETEDCCKDSAVNFQKEDKKVQQSLTIAIQTPIFIAFLSAFLGLDISTEITKAGIPFIIPEFFPPPDIRIAIQSFLI